MLRVQEECTVAADNTVRVWDFETKQQERVCIGHGFDVCRAQWHPHKSLVVSCSRDNSAILWDPRADGKGLLHTLQDHTRDVNDVKWNPFNGNWLCTASLDTTAKRWDVRNLARPFATLQHDEKVTAGAWSPLYEALLVTADGAKLTSLTRSLCAAIFSTGFSVCSKYLTTPLSSARSSHWPLWRQTRPRTASWWCWMSRS